MNKSGRIAEEFAVRTLLNDGYRILAVNYHSMYGEVDVVAADLDTICFVEVKARRQGAMIGGMEAVTLSKQKKIVKTALLYLQEKPCELQPRFDVFTIETKGNIILRHEHVKGAFDCGEYH